MISNVTTIFLLQIGIFIVYFLDNILGSGWWVMVLYMIQLFAVLVVRGKPYGAEQIVTVIFPKKACCSGMLGPLLAFTWNVVSHVISRVNCAIKVLEYLVNWTNRKTWLSPTERCNSEALC